MKDHNPSPITRQATGVAAKLRRSTAALLTTLHSRREMKLTNRKNSRGYFIFSRPRIRSVRDYDRIANFARAPGAVRDKCESIVNGMVSEARRFEARYGK